ncbi:MAG: hypothetical protein HQK54_08175 [Oligoflexales bacterium]|nr:hypothetical protein [Oligoflexales bacterium]
MGFLKNIADMIEGLIRQGLNILRRRIFGVNNERFDFFIDSFNKLSPNNQSTVVMAGIGILIVLVIAIFGIYFSRINALETELNQGFIALQDVRSMSVDLKSKSQVMEMMINNIDAKTANFRPKSFFEQIGNQQGVTMESLRSEEVNIPEDRAISKRLKYVNVEFRLPKVSIPRLLKLMGEIEKSEAGLFIQDLQIRARYGDKLYFDAQVKVTGLKKGG